MKTNMGNTDRAIRTIIAFILIGFALKGGITGGWATVAYLISAVFLMTAFVGNCPLYTLAGVSTCPRKVS